MISATSTLALHITARPPRGAARSSNEALDGGYHGRMNGLTATCGLLVLVACEGESTVCDPLATTERPASLGAVVAAGRHPDGTLYVVGRNKDGERAFRSADGTLWVRPESWCSSRSTPGGAGGLLCTLGNEFTLKVEVPPRAAIRMAVVRGSSTERDFAIKPEDALLETVSADSVTRMAVRERIGVRFEYLAALEDGRRLVVLHPEAASLLEGQARLFFGPPERVLERTISAFDRQRDGGTTFIRFDLDGSVATAFFPSSWPMNGEPTLTVGETKLNLAVTPRREETAEGLAFFCR